MASAINSDNGVVSGTAGLKSSADSSGVLDLQTNGTTAISISASQVVSFANQPTYTGGTANGVMFLNGSKAVTTGTALTFDGTNLSVGAQGEVRVYNTANTRYGRFVTTSAGTLLQSFNGAGEPLILDAPQASAYISFNVNSIEQMRLNTTGLGIGTASPAAKLDVSGGSIRVNEDGVGTKILTIRSNWAGVDPAINVTTSNALLLMTANTERARISAAGNFGIGTSSPLVALHVVGSGNANSIMTNQVARFSSASNAINFGDDGTDGLIGVGNSGSNLSLLARVGGVYSKALTVNSNSTITTTATISVGNATPTTSGAGVTFPATQSASSDANTLDDYEEGTFTPAFANGTFTYGVRTGFYTKIGRLVTVNFFIMWSAKSGAGTLSVNGFPFTSTSAASYRATGAVGYTAGVGFAVGTQITWAMSQNYTGADLAIVITDAATQFADVSGMSAAGEIQGTISYIV